MSRLTIHRSAAAGDGFVMVPNTLARPGGGLSGLAVAVLIYLLSHRDGFNVTSETIAKEFKNGRDAVRTAMKELRTLGYVTVAQKKDENGDWRHYMSVYDAPSEVRVSSAGISGAGESGAEEPGPFKKINEKKTKKMGSAPPSHGSARQPTDQDLDDLADLLDANGADGDDARAVWWALRVQEKARSPLHWARARADKGELQGFLNGLCLDEGAETDCDPTVTVRVATTPDPWGSAWRAAE